MNDGSMAIVYSNNVVEIAVQMTTDIGTATCVWHMRDDDVLAAQAVEDLVEDFAGNWQDHVMDLVSSEITVVQFDYRSLDPDDGTVGTLPPVSGKPTTGGQSGVAYPPNVALLLHKNTSNRPRGRRDGRCYLPGVPVGQLTDDHRIGAALAAGAATSLDAFYNGISDTGAWNTTEHYPVVLETTAASRAPGSQSVTIGNRRVTSITLDSLVATQRDRLR